MSKFKLEAAASGLLASLLVFSGAALAQSSATASTPSTNQSDVNADRRDVQHDRADIGGDRKDLRKDARDVNHDRKDLRADKRDVRHDRRDLRKDKKHK